MEFKKAFLQAISDKPTLHASGRPEDRGADQPRDAPATRWPARSTSARTPDGRRRPTRARPRRSRSTSSSTLPTRAPPSRRSTCGPAPASSRASYCRRRTRPRRFRPGVQFTYGTFTVVGVMTALNQDFDLSARNGVPLRAKCAVTIKEQKPEFDANLAGPGANTGAGATPPPSRPGQASGPRRAAARPRTGTPPPSHRPPTGPGPRWRARAPRISPHGWASTPGPGRACRASPTRSGSGRGPADGLLQSSPRPTPGSASTSGIRRHRDRTWRAFRPRYRRAGRLAAGGRPPRPRPTARRWPPRADSRRALVRRGRRRRPGPRRRCHQAGLRHRPRPRLARAARDHGGPSGASPGRPRPASPRCRRSARCSATASGPAASADPGRHRGRPRRPGAGTATGNGERRATAAGDRRPDRPGLARAAQRRARRPDDASSCCGGGGS